MKSKKMIVLTTVLFLICFATIACSDRAAKSNDDQQGEFAEFTEEAKTCLECHAEETPGIVTVWDTSTHADAEVSCIDCHQTDANSPMVLKDVEGHEEVNVSLSMLVPPNVCAECHEERVEQFHASGHERAYLQVEAKESMQTLMYYHEGQNDPKLSGAPAETGCYQCHGNRIVVDDTGHPTADTYPTSGIGNVYPDDDVGNCVVCHTRHSFSIAEARRPEACASCHLGPDHPDIEIYEASKHGQVYHSDGENWVWDRPPGEWEPGDYAAPTCATCHMSGIGDLEMTHNVSERLYWNLWAKVSKPRTDPDVMGMYYGDADKGRELMTQVCTQCHSTTLVEGHFASADKAVNLYNEVYFARAETMRADLAEKGLLKDNEWKDEFLITYYYLWHHEGRRARQGAAMAGADWAHWHGFFDLMQDIYKLEDIYKKRIETGAIE
jgi:formate-dependent nitrite reductase cytochrome c552 subunit